MFLVPLAGAAMGTAGAAGASLFGMSAGMTSLVGAGMSAAGTLFEGFAQKQSMDAAADMAKANAAISRDNAAQVRNETTAAEGAQRRDARRELGAIAAAIGQNGGGSELLLRQSVTDAELDALNIRYRGATEAHAHLVEGANYDAEASNMKAQGKAAVIKSVLGAGGRLLAGVGDYGVWSASRTPTPTPSVMKPGAKPVGVPTPNRKVGAR